MIEVNVLPNHFPTSFSHSLYVYAFMFRSYRHVHICVCVCAYNISFALLYVKFDAFVTNLFVNVSIIVIPIVEIIQFRFSRDLTIQFTK